MCPCKRVKSTVADGLQVQIGGAPFPHRLYQFALAHSGWRHATVVTTGESFLALSTGLQAALWALGGVPEEHRTDSLSAAFNNLAEQEQLTQRYTDLCRHYGLRASRCNPGQSNENGSIESRHDSLKTALDQALRLRASRCFDSQTDYETFVGTIVQRFNARAAKFMVAERPMLKPLPVRRTAEFEELPARVSKYAIFTIKGVLYSAPSQLIGQRLMVRQYTQHIECWLGGQCVLSRPRARPAQGQRVGRSIDYRHLVGALKRKPGAFARWVLRDAAFPPCGVPTNLGAPGSAQTRTRSLQDGGGIAGPGRRRARGATGAGAGTVDRTRPTAGLARLDPTACATEQRRS